MNNLAIALSAAAGNLAGSADETSNAWDLSKFQPATSSTWDIGEAVWGTTNQLYYGANPRGLVFKPDGSKIYTVDSSTNEIREFSAPQPWSTRDLTENHAFATTSQQSSPAAIYIKPDGTKIYVTGFSQDAVHEYDLSTAWDLSTITYNNKTVSISNEEANATGLFFKTDGTKMYVCGTTGDDVNEYDLSTAWDVSTASYSQNFSVSSQDTVPRDIQFKADGLTMYIVGDSGNTVDEYSLSTAWDVSTASHVQSLSVGGVETVPTAVAFKPDGTMMFVIGTAGDDINEYILDPIEFSVNSQQTTAEGVFFKTDGTRMYTIGALSDRMHQYDLSTAWDLTTATYTTNNYFSAGSQDGNPTGMYWKSDGTQFWLSGAGGDEVNAYTCSTAWDITTTSYSKTFSVSAQETDVQDVHFKSDGTKMYIVGTAGRDVNEYDLSTAWDIATASYSQNFSVGGDIGLLNQVLNPSGLFFKSDGTKMYVSGYGTVINEKITEFELSTAWDVSTASVSHYRNIRVATDFTHGIYFKPDGTSLFIVGESRNKVIRFDVEE